MTLVRTPPWPSARGASHITGHCPQRVMPGLDPGIHRLCEKVFAKMDGLPGQARQ
jgi:hypothetical protein